MCEGVIVYIFGYGSLIWRPGFPYVRKFDAYIKGWRRYFWQGSTDHRGTPEQPGRVVTLVKDTGNAIEGETWGTVYCVPEEEAEVILRNLDYREKGGYVREEVNVYIKGQAAHVAKAILYVATEKNTCFVGEAPVEDIAHQIYKCVGPSGPNIDYLLNLAHSLRKMNVIDEHVFALEKLARDLVMRTPLPHHTHPSLFEVSVPLSASPESKPFLTNTATFTTTAPDTALSMDSTECKDEAHSSNAQMEMQRRYFLGTCAVVKGVVCIDDGAVMAVSQRGRSLLAAGISSASGNFKPHELVSVVNRAGVEIARGMSSYGSDEINRISGHHSSNITNILGFSRGEAVVHHHNMILV